MRRLVAAAGLVAVALAAVAYAYASSGPSAGRPQSGVFGRAMVGGPCPVALEVQTPCSEHPIRATITVMRSSGRVGTVHARLAGRFRIALAPGKYRLVPRQVGSAHAPPVNIQVPVGSFVRVNVRYRSINR